MHMNSSVGIVYLECRMQEASMSDGGVSSDIKLSISKNMLCVFRYHSRFRELSKLDLRIVEEK